MTARFPWPTRQQCLTALREGSGHGVKIAVLDTGVDASHPAFENCHFGEIWQTRWTEQGPVVEEEVSSDTSGHGTAIAGIIHQMAPAAELISIRVLDGNSRQHRHEMIRAGALFALEKGAMIFNCSFGVPGTSYTLTSYKEWTDLIFYDRGTVIGASSNESENLPEWPAHLASVIGVTAADCNPGTVFLRPGHPVSFAAPGVGITVPVPGGGYTKVTGSSFATAWVSGLLGRLVSEFPGISPSMMRESLEHFAQEGEPK